MLHMLSESILTSKELTEELFDEIKELVEVRGSKADVADYSGKTALHYLAMFFPSPCNIDSNAISNSFVEFERNVINQAKLQDKYCS